MSGIEVAGLLLGAFPVFLECLQSYLEISEMSDYKPVLVRIKRRLKVEKCKLNNTCRSLVFCFVLIILYSLYLEYDSPLIPSASGLAG
jgi:hypothetical protein